MEKLCEDLISTYNTNVLNNAPIQLKKSILQRNKTYFKKYRMYKRTQSSQYSY